MKTNDTNLETGTKSVAIVGLGVIGSHLLPLVGRMPTVGHVTLVDFDRYEQRNIASQSITAADIGHPKAIRQAERLRESNPRLSVTPIVARVENVPLGALRAHVIAGCLDSLLARRIVNRIAWQLGATYVDSAVEGDGKLARIQVFRPDAAGSCMECSWAQQEYDVERESFACDATPREAAPTNAPASLGALAAAMQAIEIEKILKGEWERVAVAHEVMLDANSHRHLVTRLPRNPACRFDHRTLRVQPFHGTPEALTLADLFATGADELRVEGQPFARQWACGTCGVGLERFGLRERIASSVLCPRCGHGMRAVGFHTLERLPARLVPAGQTETPLSELGFQPGDIFSAVIGGEETHFEITAPSEDHE